MSKTRQTLDFFSHHLTFRGLTTEQWTRLKHLMRERPQWYVLRRALWEAGPWQAVGGPFRHRRAAQHRAERWLQAHTGDLGGPPTAEYEVQVASLTETLRIYNNDVPRLVEDLEAAADDDRAAG